MTTLGALLANTASRAAGFATVPAANLRLLQLLGRHPLLLYFVHIYFLGFASLLFYRHNMFHVLVMDQMPGFYRRLAGGQERS